MTEKFIKMNGNIDLSDLNNLNNCVNSKESRIDEKDVSFPPS